MAKFHVGQEVKLVSAIAFGGSLITPSNDGLPKGAKGIITSLQSDLQGPRYAVKFEGRERGVSILESFLEAA